MKLIARDYWIGSTCNEISFDPSSVIEVEPENEMPNPLLRAGVDSAEVDVVILSPLIYGFSARQPSRLTVWNGSDEMRNLSIDIWPYQGAEKEVGMGRDYLLRVMRDITRILLYILYCPQSAKQTS